MAKTKENDYDEKLRKIHQFFYGFHRCEEKKEFWNSEFPIHYAIHNGDPITLRQLGIIGDTALHVAARESYVRVESLLKLPVDITVKNSEGDTALHVYLKRKYFSITHKKGKLSYKLPKYILSAHVDRNVTANPIDENGLSHFHIACMVNHTEAVSFFLSNGVSPDTPETTHGFTPLQLAVRYGCYETAMILLEHKADINIKNKDGHVLIDLIKIYNWEICEDDVLHNDEALSVNIRIAPLVTVSEFIKFHIACLADDVEVVAKFLKSNAAKVDEPDEAGFTALHWAMHAKNDFSDCSIIDLLLKNGANLMKKNNKCQTPLDIFIHKSYLVNAEKVVSSIEKHTNLISFASQKSRDVFYSIFDCLHWEKIIKSEGVNVNDVCVSDDSKLWPGFTLLHAAVLLPIDTSNAGRCSCQKFKSDEANECSAIRLLVKNGADMTIKNADGQTPLHIAVNKSDDSTLDFLLQQYPEKIRTNPVDKTGLSHFHIACVRGECQLVERFLRSKVVNINHPIRNDLKNYRAGSTPLHIAVLNQNDNMVSLLLKNGADVYTKDADDFTPIHRLTYWYELSDKIVESLLSVPNVTDENHVSATGLSHFHVACMTKHHNVVENFMKQGGFTLSPATNQYDSEGLTPFHFAIKYDQWENIEIILKHADDISLPKSDCISFLQNALKKIDHYSANGYSPKSKLNFEKAKKVFGDSTFEQKFLNSIDEVGIQPLHIACIFSDESRVEDLLSCGADVNAQITSKHSLWPGYTPLHLGAKFHNLNDESNFEVVKLLLKGGADVTLKNDYGRTPIMIAEQDKWKRSPLASSIFQQSSEMNGILTSNPNCTGYSHFHLACKENQADLVERFLNTDLISFYTSIDTPLHLAVKFNAKCTAALLIKHGHEINVEDDDMRTPLYYAFGEYERDTVEMVELLLRSGASVNVTDISDLTPLNYELLTLRMGGQFSSDNLAAGIKVLLQHGARIIASGENLIQKPMFYCHVNVARTMISEAADVLDVDKDGKSTMHHLVAATTQVYDVVIQKNDYITLIHRLLERGGNLNCQDNHGNTPLHHAVLQKNAKGVSALLSLGADPNVIDKNHKTALELCVNELSENSSKRDIEMLEGCLTTISNYIAGMKMLKLCVSMENQSCLVASTNEEKIIFDQSEIEAFKEIYVFGSLTFYDILFEISVEDISELVPAEIIEYKLKSVDFYLKFPALAGFLSLKYSQARQKVAKEQKVR